MIVEYKKGDITQGPERHVAFAVNREGYNQVGLAGDIADTCWPELANTGLRRMGEILSKGTGRKVFHAFVVHSLEEGWTEAPRYIEACFNELDVPTDKEVASVLMGAGRIGLLSGVDSAENLNAMERSDKRIVLYDIP